MSALPPHNECPGSLGLRQAVALAAAQWRLLGAITLGGCLLAIVWTLLFSPTVYQARASLLPVDRSNRPDLAKELTARLPLALEVLGSKEDKAILAFLQSRRLKIRLIEGENLLGELYGRPWDKLIGILGANRHPSAILAIQEGRMDRVYAAWVRADSPLIELTWNARDPVEAARLLERVIAELQAYLETEYETDAGRERRFVEAQAIQAAALLRQWEVRIPDRETTLAVIQREATAAARLHAELTSRLAAARIEEARRKVAFKVLDAPLPPVKKHAPRMGIIILLSAAASLLAGLTWVFLFRLLRREPQP